MVRYITATVIYKAHALNRDEKIGGNILSVKKLSLEDGPHTFLSRVALRHYLFQTLVRAHDEAPPWTPAPVKVVNAGGKKVVQFDLDRANVLTHAELDLFGYMVTADASKGSKRSKAAKQEGESSSEGSSETTLRRKAVIGITKAISVAPHMGDLAFYANHDLVERALQAGDSATPSPYSKEEHHAYYKVSFVIDTLRLGVDEWVGVNLPKTFQASEEGEIIELPSGKRFIAHEDKRRERLEAVLEAIKGGLYAQSSGELNTLVPYFLAIAFVKVPSPILDPSIYWPPDTTNESGELCAPLNPWALRNPWYIPRAKEGGIYVEGIFQGKSLIPCLGSKQGELIQTWEELLEFADRAISETQSRIKR